MICTVVIGLIAVFCAYMYYLQTFSRIGQMLNKYPGSKGYPVLGNLFELRGGPVHVFRQFRKNYAAYKQSYKFWSFGYGVIGITTPEDAEIILRSNKHIKKSIVYEFLTDWLGTGLLTSTGQKWHHRRKLLTPAFHFNILRQFTVSFGEHAQTLIEDLKKECTKPKTSIVPYISHTTLQAICETAMGTSIDPTDKMQQSYLQSIYDLGDLVVDRTASPWLFNDFIFNMLPIGWKHSRLVKSLHKFTLKVIEERQANFKESDLENLDKDDDGITKKKRLAMLDLLISAQRNKGSIDDNGIREEVNTFMFEGHDTTSVGISFTLMVLANEKEHQDKIFQELEEIFGDSKRPATYEDLQKMPYLELCLKESQRMYPSVPLISRHIDEDLQLSTGVAPANITLDIHIYDLHYDERNFPNPNKFDPERFLPENCKGRHPYSYVPFSAGPRNCIGQKFAMLEMKSIISAILRNYVLEPVDTPETMNLKLDFVLRNEGDIYVKFKPRV